MAWWSAWMMRAECPSMPDNAATGRRAPIRSAPLGASTQRLEMERLEERLLLAQGTPVPAATLAVSDADLIAHWAFDDGGGTVAADTSPFGADNAGTLHGDADWSPFGLNGSIQLDGDGDFVSVPDSPDLNLTIHDQRTIAAWFLVDDASIGSRKQVIYEEGGTARGLSIYIHAGRLYVGAWNEPSGESGWAGTFLNSDSLSPGWHHVAFVLSGTPTVAADALTAFLDGTAFASGPGSQLWQHGGDIGIGQVNGFTKFHDGDTLGAEHGLAGLIDDVRVYNRVLTPEEVQVLASEVLAAPVPAVAERIASGLSRPLFVTAPPGDADRLFIIEQHSGRIKILDLHSGEVATTPYLDLDGLATGGEQGLLGLAFHPDYPANGFFYVNIIDAGGTTNIRRYTVSTADSNVADPASALTVLTIAQPQSNHNGGWLGFGPDGMLYVATGDGGGSDDNDAGHTADTGNAQDITSNLLGKILRIDIDGDDFPADPNRNYALPPDNPFVGATGDDEIWAYGLRNPWRPGFDRLTGDLYIADVGQGAREEVNVQAAGSTGGENYGWRLREGSIATPTGGVGGPRPPGAIDPIYEYTHGSGTNQGHSVTGGYVYRGFIPQLEGQYFFGDFVAERIWSVRYDGTTAVEFQDWTARFVPDVGTIDQIASFGEDARGNLYIVDLGGEIFRVTAPPVSDAALAAYWRFDEVAGSTAADSAPSGVDDSATLQGDADWNPSGRSGAVELDGSGDFVAVPDSTDLNLLVVGQRTIAAWVFVNDPAISSRKQVIYEEGGKSRGLNAYVHAGMLYVGAWNTPSGESGWAGTFLASDQIQSGRWHHVALVLSGSDTIAPGALTGYLDGVPFGSGPGSQVWQHGGDIGIGGVAGFTKFHDGDTFGAGHGLAGLIDDFRVYNRVLTPVELQRLAMQFLVSPPEPAPADPVLFALPQSDKVLAVNRRAARFGDREPDDAVPEVRLMPPAETPISLIPIVAANSRSIDDAMLEPSDDPLESVLSSLAEDWTEQFRSDTDALPPLV